MDSEVIMCVRADDVKFREGLTIFTDPNETELHQLLNFVRFRPRRIAESNEHWKQIIVYAYIRNGDKVYRYTRTGGDDRLVSRGSIGIGGHVNTQDVSDSDFEFFNAILIALERELKEEISYTDNISPVLVGVINDNSDHVGRVHLGVVFEIQVDGAVVTIDENASDGKWADVDWLMEDLNKFESWSQLLIIEHIGEGSWGSTTKESSIPF